MSKGNDKLRKHHPFLNKFKIARILGISPQNLTTVNGYVRTSYRQVKTTMQMTDKKTMKTMKKMDIKVSADSVKKEKEHNEEMGMSEYYNVVPTDMYGNRESLQKDGDIQAIIKDRNMVHGLD